MTEPDFLDLFVRPLESAGVTYMITGGVASVIYGDPRFTRDVDIVVEMDGSDVGRFLAAFSKEAFYLPPADALREEVARSGDGHVNVVHRDTALRADIYIAGGDPLYAWAFPRRRRLTVGDFEIWLAPLEYVVIRKLQYFRDSGSDRHLRDVAMMLHVSGDTLEEGALGEWSARLGLDDVLVRARGFEV